MLPCKAFEAERFIAFVAPS